MPIRPSSSQGGKSNNSATAFLSQPLSIPLLDPLPTFSQSFTMAASQPVLPTSWCRNPPPNRKGSAAVAQSSQSNSQCYQPPESLRSSRVKPPARNAVGPSDWQQQRRQHYASMTAAGRELQPQHQQAPHSSQQPFNATPREREPESQASIVMVLQQIQETLQKHVLLLDRQLLMQQAGTEAVSNISHTLERELPLVCAQLSILCSSLQVAPCDDRQSTRSCPDNQKGGSTSFKRSRVCLPDDLPPPRPQPSQRFSKQPSGQAEGLSSPGAGRRTAAAVSSAPFNDTEEERGAGNPFHSSDEDILFL